MANKTLLTILSDFCHSWTISGSIRGHYGVTWGSFWRHFVVVLVSFWPHLRPFWCVFDPFGRFYILYIMQFDEGLGAFWTVVVRFCPPFDRFWAVFWPYRGLYRAILGLFWRSKIGPFWGDFGMLLEHFGRSGAILGSLGNHFGIVLASLLVRLWPF